MDREPAREDAVPDDNRDQKPGAGELGQQPPANGSVTPTLA
jgi:hypothetical protein